MTKQKINLPLKATWVGIGFLLTIYLISDLSTFIHALKIDQVQYFLDNILLPKAFLYLFFLYGIFRVQSIGNLDFLFTIGFFLWLTWNLNNSYHYATWAEDFDSKLYLLGKIVLSISIISSILVHFLLEYREKRSWKLVLFG